MSKVNDNAPLSDEQIRELKAAAAKALNVVLQTAEDNVAGMRLAIFQVKVHEPTSAEDSRRAVNLFLFKYCNKNGWPASFAVETALELEPMAKEA